MWHGRTVSVVLPTYNERDSIRQSIEEIIATGVADELINRVGPGTIFRMQERLGVTTADVARAYAIVRGILHLDEVWADCLEGRMDETQRVQALLEVRELVEHLTSWLLRNRRDQTRPSTELDRFAGSVRQLMELARS